MMHIFFIFWVKIYTKMV